MATNKISAKDFAVMHERFQRGLGVARALDSGEPMPHSIRLLVMDVDSFLESLTPKRFALLKLARKAPRSIAELASAAKRDPSAVSKDVSRLKAMGLVRVTEIVNAGHGVKKVIEPIANQIEISAQLL